MVLGNNTGFRCPNCGAAHVWEVDDCDACGYRSEASRGWERERKAQARRDDANGCLWGSWCDIWLIGDLLEGLIWVGRGIVVAVRAVVSALT